MSAITFDAATHSYWLDGHRLPSVTQILAPLNNFAGIPPEVLAAKAELGTAVHVATELDDANDLIEESVHDRVRPYLEAWRAFKRDSGAQVLASEQQVYHPLHRYCGTLDRVLLIDGAKHLADIKTSAALPASVGPQTAAYQLALEDASVIRRSAIQLRDDGTYRVHSLNDPNDKAVFLACLSIHRFKEKNA